MSNLIVILPLMHRKEVEQFNRCIPLDLFPDGIKNLMVCALENQDNCDSFISDFFDMLQSHIEDLNDYRRVDHYCALLAKEQYMSLLEVFLQNFFMDFSTILRDLIGQNQVSFIRVISWRVIGGLCVELKHEPLSKIPHY